MFGIIGGLGGQGGSKQGGTSGGQSGNIRQGFGGTTFGTVVSGSRVTKPNVGLVVAADSGAAFEIS